MRTFWLGLAVAAMATAAWGADEMDVKIGDWLKTKTTLTTAGMDKPSIMTTQWWVKAIEDGFATLDTKTTTQDPRRNKPDVVHAEQKVPFERLNWHKDPRHRNLDQGHMKKEVVEEGERTVEVNGRTFENVFYQKVKVTFVPMGRPAREEMLELWDDVKAPFGQARILKQTITGPGTVRVHERLGYGRAGDPIPDDSD